MRIHSGRPLLALVLAAVTVGALAGCASGARPWMPDPETSSASPSVAPSDEPSESPTPSTEPEPGDDDAEQIDCADTPEVTIADANSVVDLIGQCTVVTVNGANSSIKAEDIDGLLIQAPGTSVEAQSVGIATLAGAEMILRVSGDVALLTINGDLNIVQVDGTIASLIVGGNENNVLAGERISLIVDNGAENVINPR